MEKDKTLTRQTNVLLILNFLVAFWDMGLATYHFIEGRWIAGVLIVAVVCFMLWMLTRLFITKHDTERMRMRHEYVMEVLKSVDKRRFAEEVSDEG